MLCGIFDARPMPPEGDESVNKDDLYQSRIDKVLEGMKKMKLDGLIVSDPKSIRYLTGIYNEPYERLFVLYLSADKNHVFFLNKLFNVDQKRSGKFGPAIPTM